MRINKYKPPETVGRINRYIPPTETAEEPAIWEKEWWKKSYQELVHPEAGFGEVPGRMAASANKYIGNIAEVLPYPIGRAKGILPESAKTPTRTLSDFLKGGAEEYIEKTGGEDIYTKGAELGVSAVPLGRAFKMAGAVPGLATPGKVFAGQGAKAVVGNLVRRGAKGVLAFGGVRGIETGTLEGLVEGAVSGAAFEIGLPVVGLPLGKAVGAVKKAMPKPSISDVVVRSWGYEPLTVRIAKTGTNAGKAIKRRFEDPADTITRINHEFTSDLARLQKYSPELYDKFKILQSARGDASVQVNESLKEALAPVRGKYVRINGKTKLATELAEDIATGIRATRALELGKKMPPGMAERLANLDNEIFMLEGNSKTAQLVADAKKAADGLFKMSDDFLTHLENTGYTDPEAAALMRENWPDHIPFQRVFDALEVKDTKGAGGLKNILKQFKGSEREINSPIENIVRNQTRGIAEANRNQAVRDTVIQLKEAGVPITTRPATVPAYSKEEITKVLDELGIDNVTPEMLKPFYSTGRKPTNLAENELSYVENGKHIIAGFEDSMLKDSLASSPNPQLASRFAQALYGIGKTSARMLRLGVTAHPDFSAGNIPRDAITILHNDPGIIPKGSPVYKTIVDTIKYPGTVANQIFVEYPQAFSTMLFKPEEWQRIQRAGGGGSEFFGTEKSITKQISQIARSPAKFRDNPARWLNVNIFEKVNPAQPIRTLDNALNGLIELAATGEKLTRSVAFKRVEKRMLAREVSPEEAAKQGALAYREFSTDFAEQGKTTKKISPHVAFFGASLGGPRTMLRAAKANPTGFGIKLMQGLMVPTAIFWYKNHEKEWYRQLSARDRMSSWYVADGVRVPKPWDLALVANLTEATLDKAYNENPDAVNEAMESLMAMGPASPSPPLLTAAKGLMSNTHPFWKSDIEPSWQNKSGMSPHLKGGARTSETGKLITSKLRAITDPAGLSPDRFDYLVSTLMGRLGTEAINLSDKGIKKYREITTGEDYVYPEGRLQDVPVVRRFYQGPTGERLSTKPIQKFWRNYRQAEAVHLDRLKLEKNLENQGGSTLEAKNIQNELEKLYQDKGWQDEIYTGMMNDVSKTISELIDEMRDIDQGYPATGMSGKEKKEKRKKMRDRMGQIAMEINNMAEEVNSEWEEIMDSKKIKY